MQMSTNSKTLVDPRHYRSFCFRGEGRANFVISAKHRKTDVRIVWRFAKARQTGLMTVKARSEMVNNYMERIVAPFYDDQYLVNMNIVEFNTMDVHHLAKIPSLPANQKIENFEELLKLPEDLSFLPLSSFRRQHGNVFVTAPKTLSSLQMLDATQLPNSNLFDGYSTETITVEIKPKQGFLQKHPNVGIPHCNNCIMQIEKCGSDHFSEMYDFCPLDLFSGNYSRMQKAINSLFLIPHRNLRIFVNGNLVHSDKKPLEAKSFDSVLFPRGFAKTEDLNEALCLVLSGNFTKKQFKLQENSVLGQILAAQKIDEIGIVKAHVMYDQLEADLKAKLLDKTSLSRLGIDEILSELPSINMGIDESENLRKLQKLRRYFVAATMKDCSVMVSMRFLSFKPEYAYQNMIRLQNGKLCAFSIKIVDLDPKTPKNLTNSYSRFMAGVKLIKLENESKVNQGKKINRCRE